MLGIGRPISCKVQIAIRSEKRRQIMNQLWLDEPPLVVSLFMPGIREKKNGRLRDELQMSLKSGVEAFLPNSILGRPELHNREPDHPDAPSGVNPIIPAITTGSLLGDNHR